MPLGCYFELYLCYEDLLTMTLVYVIHQAVEFRKTRIHEDFPHEFPYEFIWRAYEHLESGGMQKNFGFNAAHP